jgi:hypothetical protein
MGPPPAALSGVRPRSCGRVFRCGSSLVNVAVRAPAEGITVMAYTCPNCQQPTADLLSNSAGLGRLAGRVVSGQFLGDGLHAIGAVLSGVRGRYDYMTCSSCQVNSARCGACGHLWIGTPTPGRSIPCPSCHVELV